MSKRKSPARSKAAGFQRSDEEAEMKLLQCVMLTALAAPAMAQVTVEEIEYEVGKDRLKLPIPMYA